MERERQRPRGTGASSLARDRLTIEVFLTDGPLPGFGALELVDPPSPDAGDPAGLISCRFRD
ncbi:MAG: hypothetical protein JOZ98_20425 [Solirubrobacterales bacterium]|nr:hypothetical protein [Solirubrobacterales bacterium]MBV9798760.1 hypothetical protein [Solirubrobacterales bacterium]